MRPPAPRRLRRQREPTGCGMVDGVAEDYTMTMDGLATRWLPSDTGNRLVRCPAALLAPA